MNALSATLGSKKYFPGDQPTTPDTSGFGHLINIIGCPIESPLKEYGLTKKNLNSYVNRIK
ncbi:glutathione S-transferase C-terminal domain-containing protein [Nitrosomonas supralitoralis]|uniref:glutathione S-transferase C-terminal domain-containing protein n=1 Tax=Nitrosomonas supralitoralis TaxID=2116706 RepID=UPI001F5B71F6|nr:glutathione S-transferase C-terminal domain-containing protein [Nitrosomonas supralitoralis]